MVKETVRYTDDLVDRIEDYDEESDLFESKSEIYRFASQFVMELVTEYEPSEPRYFQIKDELEDELDLHSISEDNLNFDYFDFLNSVIRLCEDEDLESGETVEQVLDLAYDNLLEDFPESDMAETVGDTE